ncbi:hypothetical protein AB6A40_005251 [Gnathostoma spinigerum]|uniref:Transmembrane protein 222 n=1 Tax=Gnathostoma spinigerum TaxID=75299 RepID=A0ABD6EPD7_9BILA
MKVTENPYPNGKFTLSGPMEVNPSKRRYPFCVVWTPIPVITWIFPLIGHMGIATSKGVIRDFAGSYFVSEDDMAFGWPTKYWQLDPNMVDGAAEAWDRAVKDASNEYKNHIHNLLCDNCHSHVALALNTMKYGGEATFNMFNLTLALHLRGVYVGFGGFLKQWLPFFVLGVFIISIFLISYL